MTNLEMRDLAGTLDLAAIRRACGISCRRIAVALGVRTCVIWRYERGVTVPSGALGIRYLRIVAAMRNHAEIPETGCFEHLAGEDQDR